MQEIGICGSGTMGRGIAQVAATAGHQVHLFDKNPRALEDAENFLESILNRQVEKGRYSQEKVDSILGNIHFDDQIEALKGVDLIIEAIVERKDVKRDLFHQLELLTSPNAVLASNTSSLSITSIASACEHSERVVGTHFFNPAPLMALVEVIPAIQSDGEIVDRMVGLMEAWGKIPVRAKDSPGFIVNRIARPFYSEALRIKEEGLADPDTIDWAMEELGGFRMGPFKLMDFIGHDVNYKVTSSMFEAYHGEPRYKPSFTQQRLVEAGYLGRKSGKGFYEWEDKTPDTDPLKNEELGQDILWRILVMLINEAADALFWDIATKKDIDLAMTKGVNYPKGLLRWADERGIDECVYTMDRLFDEYKDPRYRCSPLLRQMKRKGETFYNG